MKNFLEAMENVTVISVWYRIAQSSCAMKKDFQPERNCVFTKEISIYCAKAFKRLPATTVRI